MKDCINFTRIVALTLNIFNMAFSANIYFLIFVGFG